MREPVLSRERLILRPVQDGDAEQFFSHGRDPEIVRMYGADPDEVPPMTWEQAQNWFDDLRQNFPAWVIELDGAAIGVIRLHSQVQQDRRARLALGLFASQYLGQGFGREAIRLVLKHGFTPEDQGGLGLNRVDLRVIAYNERAIRCYRACGFIEEGREREAARVGDTYHDDLIMAVLAREFG